MPEDGLRESHGNPGAWVVWVSGERGCREGGTWTVHFISGPGVSHHFLTGLTRVGPVVLWSLSPTLLCLQLDYCRGEQKADTDDGEAIKVYWHTDSVALPC